MKKIILVLLVLVFVQKHFDAQCQSYGFDKGAILSFEGVYCERTVHDSYTTAYLPLSGARLEFGYKNKIEPQAVEVQGSLDTVDRNERASL